MQAEGTALAPEDTKTIAACKRVADETGNLLPIARDQTGGR